MGLNTIWCRHRNQIIIDNFRRWTFDDKGILGRKIGMTQVFGENGELIPVTVVEAKENVVLQKENCRS